MNVAHIYVHTSVCANTLLYNIFIIFHAIDSLLLRGRSMYVPVNCWVKYSM